MQINPKWDKNWAEFIGHRKDNFFSRLWRKARQFLYALVSDLSRRVRVLLEVGQIFHKALLVFFFLKGRQIGSRCHMGMRWWGGGLTSFDARLVRETGQEPGFSVLGLACFQQVKRPSQSDLGFDLQKEDCVHWLKEALWGFSSIVLMSTWHFQTTFWPAEWRCRFPWCAIDRGIDGQCLLLLLLLLCKPKMMMLFVGDALPVFLVLVHCAQR